MNNKTTNRTKTALTATFTSVAAIALGVTLTLAIANPATVFAVPSGETSLENSLLVDMFISSGNAAVDPLPETSTLPFSFLSGGDDDAPGYSFNTAADFDGFSLNGLILEGPNGEIIAAEILQGNDAVLEIIKTLLTAGTVSFGEGTDISDFIEGDGTVGTYPEDVIDNIEISSSPEPATALLAGLAVFAVTASATRRRRN